MIKHREVLCEHFCQKLSKCKHSLKPNIYVSWEPLKYATIDCHVCKGVAVQFKSLRLFYVTKLCQLMNNCVPKYSFHVSRIGKVELGDCFQKILGVHSP